MKKKNKTFKETIFSILLILPSIILVAIFVYGFVGYTFYVSLTDWGTNPAESLKINPTIKVVGFENYKRLFNSFFYSGFRQDLVNTIFYTASLLVGILLVGLILAILLDRKVKNEPLLRTIFLYPLSLSFIVSGTIWRWLVAPNGGFNVIPTWFGLKKGTFLWTSSKVQIFKFDWQNIWRLIFIIGAVVFVFFLISELRKRNRCKKRIITWSSLILIFLILIFVVFPFIPKPLENSELHGFNLATIGIIIAAIWQYSGYAMALYLAGLRGLPSSIKESAKLDGASEFSYYTKIAIPNLRPITMSAIVIMAHISLKMFDLIYAMAGADNGNTSHPSINMYLTTFRENRFALGGAIAVILFLFAAVLIIPYMIHSHHERRGG